jgi:hypothetical protein
LGEGPVYPISDGIVPGGEPLWKVLWVANSSYSGRVLIRGRQLDGSNPVLFNTPSKTPISLSVTRTIKGGSVAFFLEMDLLETGTPTVPTPGWRGWPSYTYAPTRGCYAWQVDGTNFTEVLIFQAS